MTVGIVYVAMSLVYVWISKRLVDIATNRAEGSLWLYVAFMLGCLAAQVLLSAYTSRLEVESEIDVQNRLRHKLFSHIMDSKSYNKKRFHTGDAMNRLLADVDNISNTLCVVAPQSIVTALQFGSALIYLAVLDMRLAVIVTLVLPVCMVLGRVYARRIRQYTGEIRDMDSKVQSHIQEYMHHRTLVASMEYTPQVVDDLESMQNTLREKVMRRTGFTLLSHKIMQAGFSAGYMAAFVWGLLALRAGAGYGIMTAFMQLAGQVQRPMMELSRQLPNFIHLTTSIDRVSAIVALPKEEHGESIDLGRGVGVRLQDVSFSYDGNKQILKDLSFDFKPGTISAVVGHTGAGKSTLMRMMLGLISPEKGACEFYNDSQAVASSPMTRCNVAYVPQGNSLLSGTVRSNLLLGDPTASEERMREVLHTAVADFIFNLPDGLDTPCNEAGGGLSEGQAQRIAIARGLLRKGDVVIMDEPTSSLDPATETLLLQRLSEFASDKTIIIVTHRSLPEGYCANTLNLDRKNA
jgi:ABC-type multidrug transport system fused ATPase/permease subunit